MKPAAYESQRNAAVPADLAAALAASPQAAQAFDALSKTQRYAVILKLVTARTGTARAAQLRTAMTAPDAADAADAGDQLAGHPSFGRASSRRSPARTRAIDPNPRIHPLARPTHQESAPRTAG
jgi:hypothetical protein